MSWSAPPEAAGGPPGSEGPAGSAELQGSSGLRGSSGTTFLDRLQTPRSRDLVSEAPKPPGDLRERPGEKKTGFSNQQGRFLVLQEGGTSPGFSTELISGNIKIVI